MEPFPGDFQDKEDFASELKQIEARLSSPAAAGQDRLVSQYFSIARLHMQQALQERDTQAAEETARRAVELFPDRLEAREILLGLLQQTGRSKEAIKTLETSLSLEPVRMVSVPARKRGAKRYAPLVAAALTLAGAVLLVPVYARWKGSQNSSVSRPSVAAPVPSPAQMIEDGIALYNRAEYIHAEDLCRQALRRLQAAKDRAGTAMALAPLGQILDAQGDFLGAHACYEEALTIRRELHEPLAIAHLEEMLGGLAQREGDYAEAERHLARSQEIRQQQKDLVGVALCLRDRGILAAEQGRYREAEADYAACLQIVAPLDKPEIEAHVHALQGMAARDQKDFKKSRCLLNESLSFWQARKQPRWIAGMKRNLAVTAFYEEQFTKAEILLRESLAGYQIVGDWYSAAETQVWLARVFAQEGRTEQALPLLKEALAARKETWSPLALARAWEAEAEILASAQMEKAESILSDAERERNTIGCPLPPAEQQGHARLLQKLSRYQQTLSQRSR